MPDSTDITTARSAWLADMLARRTGETVWVAELVNVNVHIIHQAVRPDDPVQILSADTAIPWYACALGHAIVAGLDADTQESLLVRPARRLTGLTITEPEKLRQALALTRQRGYAVEAHAATLGEAGIAAPVLDSAGRANRAVGVVGPVERLLTTDGLEALADAVRHTARALSQDT